jgi:hypothetical protein
MSGLKKPLIQAELGQGLVLLQSLMRLQEFLSCRTTPSKILRYNFLLFGLAIRFCFKASFILNYIFITQ